MSAAPAVPIFLFPLSLNLSSVRHPLKSRSSVKADERLREETERVSALRRAHSDGGQV